MTEQDDILLMQAIRLKDQALIREIRYRLNREYLMKMSKDRCALKVIYIANKCCDECAKIDETEVPLEQEIENQMLPYRNCVKDRTGCVCCYAARVVFDENGEPVRKG